MGKLMQKINQILTYNNGFKDIFNQVERGGLILIAGNPGTGKTIMASKFIYEEIANNNGIALYVSLTESKSEFLKNLKNLGIDFEKFENERKFYYLEVITLTKKEYINDLLDQIISYAEKYNASIVVIDSISPIFQAFSNKIEVRELIHNLFYRLSKLSKRKLVITEEVPYGTQNFGFGVEEFIVDAIIYLKAFNIKGRIVRLAEIKKFRGSDLSLMDIPFRIKPIELISMPRIINYGQRTSKELIIVNLGKLKYEFYKGSQNLILVNPSICKDALTIVGMLGAIVGTPYLRTGSGKTIIRIQSHLVDDFKQNIEKCFSSLQFEKNMIEIILSNIFIIPVNITKLSMVDYFDEINEQEEKIKPSIIIDLTLDSAYGLISDKEIFSYLQLNLINRRSSNNITGIYLINGLYKDLSKFPLYFMYDNIVYVRSYKNKGLIIKPIKIRFSLLPKSKSILYADNLNVCNI
jgi:circadian clock protein KaiC